MTDIIVFDLETSGIPDWKTPSGGDHQPHIVQLAAARVNVETREVADFMDVLVKPDGWEITEELTAIHGITHERALEEGEPEEEVLDKFLGFWGGRKRVAYNTTFDNRIIRIATKRFSSDQIIDDWKAGEYECAMIGSRKVMGGRNPKLEVAYKHFTGKEMEGAHNAAFDVHATIQVYFAMKEHLPDA